MAAQFAKARRQSKGEIEPQEATSSKAVPQISHFAEAAEQKQQVTPLKIAPSAVTPLKIEPTAEDKKTSKLHQIATAVQQVAASVQKKEFSPTPKTDTFVDEFLSGGEDSMEDVEEPEQEWARMTTEEFRECRSRAKNDDWSRLTTEQFREGKEAMQSSPVEPASDAESGFESVISELKDFKVQPLFVKVQNGVAHMVARVGGVLIYVETQVGEICAPAKVWVLHRITSAQGRLKDCLDPLTQKAGTYLTPVASKAGTAYAAVRVKAVAVVSPFYAKIADGVLSVQGAIGNITISIQAKASKTWIMLASQASSSYAVAYQAGDSRVRPVYVWASNHTVSAKALMLSIAQPYCIRARDGALYVQAAIGNTLVRVKVSANDRLFAPILSAYASVHGVISGHTSQVLAKVVALYDNVKSKSLDVLAPYLEKGQSMAGYTSAAINGIVVKVRVRAATIRDTAQGHVSFCYIKVKNGFIYVYGVVGDKVLCVKVSLTELMCSLTEKATVISTEALARVFAAKEHIQDSAVSMAQFARCKADKVSSQVQFAVTDRGMQMTAVGAVGGAATMGVSGGATGLATGSVIGAACGVPAAFFTFGLSIPIGAAMGGVTGLCAGAVSGGAVGLLGGGATARSVHNHKDDIKGSAMGALNKASGCKDYMTNKAKGYKESAVETTMIVKSRFVGGTGETMQSHVD